MKRMAKIFVTALVVVSATFNTAAVCAANNQSAADKILSDITGKNPKYTLVDYIHAYKQETVVVNQTINFDKQYNSAPPTIGEPPLADFGEIGKAASVLRITDEADASAHEEALKLLCSNMDVLSSEKNGENIKLVLKKETDTAEQYLIFEGKERYMRFNCPETRATVTVDLENGKFGVISSAYSVKVYDLDNLNPEMVEDFAKEINTTGMQIAYVTAKGQSMSIHLVESEDSTDYADRDIIVKSSAPSVSFGKFAFDFVNGTFKVSEFV
jgi:hypothetical protein